MEQFQVGDVVEVLSVTKSETREGISVGDKLTVLRVVGEEVEIEIEDKLEVVEDFEHKYIVYIKKYQLKLVKRGGKNG